MRHLLLVLLGISGCLGSEEDHAEVSVANTTCTNSVNAKPGTTLIFQYKSPGRTPETRSCKLSNPVTLCASDSIVDTGDGFEIAFDQTKNTDFMMHLAKEAVDCQLMEDLGGEHDISLRGSGISARGKVVRRPRPQPRFDIETTRPNFGTLNGTWPRKILRVASAWEGYNFRANDDAQCAEFVREVLSKACSSRFASSHPRVIQSLRPWDLALIGGEPLGPSYADSLAGEEVGTRIHYFRDLLPGDLVFLRNTYGSWRYGVITHVGIYIGDGNMIDRATRSAPIRVRSVSRSLFAGGLRVHSHHCL